MSAQNQNNVVSCEINGGHRVYKVSEGEKVNHSLSINDRGYVSLESDGKKIAELKIGLERRTQNIGGAEQYSRVEVPLDVQTIDGLMDVYRKIEEQNFSLRGNGADSTTGVEKEKIGKLMTSFLDKYVLNTPESREVLHEYLNKPTKSEIARREQANAYYLKSLDRGVRES